MARRANRYGISPRPAWFALIFFLQNIHLVQHCHCCGTVLYYFYSTRPFRPRLGHWLGWQVSPSVLFVSFAIPIEKPSECMPLYYCYHCNRKIVVFMLSALFRRTQVAAANAGGSVAVMRDGSRRPAPACAAACWVLVHARGRGPTARSAAHRSWESRTHASLIQNC
jgi:hypothetical protein